MTKPGRRTGSTRVRSRPARAVVSLGEPSPEAPSRRKVLVVVHGAGNLSPDYYQKFVGEVSRRLGRPIDYIPVFYGDVTISTARLTALAPQPETGSAIDFQVAFQRELQDAYASIPRSERPASITAFTLPGKINVVASIMKDITRYLFDQAVGAKARARVATALEQAAARFDEIVLFSHSLGTVVAFDMLRECAGQFGTIAYWFTSGSPLAKLRRVGMRSDDLGAIRSDTVRHWYNLYDTTDIVSDALGPAFPKPGYRLHDIYVDVARSPVASHDYMQNSETLDMVADVMR
jgi:hypothetical protein